eukprot:CAMPEP_0197852436 /NCGR_PEP_ID=MMETSP1438-20131217/20595_1 /TAXON_ID=1461541 /ORGANISM="Pterosperma sp., Strain CCMP1384" /LENGTH=227 /DNA_ID=CAMNT_0043466499 /DNA_START=84 /DNA_END=767 /DNA_ORIENTATION=-
MSQGTLLHQRPALSLSRRRLQGNSARPCLPARSPPRFSRRGVLSVRSAQDEKVFGIFEKGSTGAIVASQAWPAAVLGLSIFAQSRYAAAGGDVQAMQEKLGPGAIAVCCIYVGYIVVKGKNDIKEMKGTLEEKGFDTTGINRVGMLKYLVEKVDSGDDADMEVAREVVNAGLCKQAMQFGGGPEYSKWKQYYSQKGIEIRTAGDIEKVSEYVRELQRMNEIRKVNQD